MKIIFGLLLGLIIFITGCVSNKIEISDNPKIHFFALDNKIIKFDYWTNNSAARFEVFGTILENCLKEDCLLFFWQNEADLPKNSYLTKKDISNLVVASFYADFDSEFHKKNKQFPEYMINCDLFIEEKNNIKYRNNKLNIYSFGCITEERIKKIVEEFK